MATRPLNFTQADACENARYKRCRCRCGGALHGAARGIPFDKLPTDDPHFTDYEPTDSKTASGVEEIRRAIQG